MNAELLASEEAAASGFRQTVSTTITASPLSRMPSVCRHPSFTGLIYAERVATKASRLEEVAQDKRRLSLSLGLSFSSSFLLILLVASNYGSENIFKNVTWIQLLLYSSPVK